MATLKQATTVYEGSQLKGMFAAATLWLERSYREIDALNVFPVPDGDTGTNMLLTMRSSMEEVERVATSPASAVAAALARGALMGARGNSGVILSQFFRGLAQGLEGRERFTPAELAAAFAEAAALAYKGLSRPVEGTILTVIREAAEVGHQTADRAELASWLEAVVAAAAGSVARTPTLLPVLRQAGVVDAGGQGFYAILEGALRYLKGEALGEGQPYLIPAATPMVVSGEVALEEECYGYCTEFLVTGQGLDADQVRKKLERKGKSLMVVGDGEMVKVHLHTFDPGGVLRYATRLGSLHDVLIRNMDDQHRDFKQMGKGPALPIATVAVTWGEGMAQVFHSLGVTAIVPGGNTMNPSTQELLRAVEAVPSEQVIILPNNRNVVAAAAQVPSLTSKTVVVVPTETLPQGVAALLAFSPEVAPQANVAAMERARQGITTLEITRAVRPARVGGVKVKKGQAIALLEGELVAAGVCPAEVVAGLLARLRLEQREVITLYCGGDAHPGETQAIAELFRSAGPGEVEVVVGGQPYYDYIISLE